jgi:hypothetical protein
MYVSNLNCPDPRSTCHKSSICVRQAYYLSQATASMVTPVLSFKSASPDFANISRLQSKLQSVSATYSIAVFGSVVLRSSVLNQHLGDGRGGASADTILHKLCANYLSVRHLAFVPAACLYSALCSLPFESAGI